MEKLTKQSAENLIEEIKLIAWDSETAHEREKYLYERFITSVSLNHYSLEESVEVSKIVLSSKYIEFSRWFA